MGPVEASWRSPQGAATGQDSTLGYGFFVSRQSRAAFSLRLSPRNVFVIPKRTPALCRNIFISSVQSLSSVWLFVTPWIAAHQASLSITNSRSSPKLMSIELVMPSSHLILCHPLLLLPTIPPSIRVFSNESTLCMRWPKYWSFSISISPSKEHPGLISFRMDWLGLLAVQGTLKSLFQHHSSKALILRRSAFFTVQLSHPYMTTGKTIALTRRTFVGKVQSLLFNMLSRLVITFLPRSKRLLISWPQHFHRGLLLGYTCKQLLSMDSSTTPRLYSCEILLTYLNKTSYWNRTKYLAGEMFAFRYLISLLTSYRGKQPLKWFSVI